MSGIVLSSAVRQNLLALQDTAASLATTQNDLSTGKKVNSALDNPTNFFTAAGLDNRASDISNLLDGISNGVQVLQAANTGITSVESLVSQAKSIANQALQAPIGYSAKASVSTTITGATSDNLVGGSGSPGNAVAAGQPVLKGNSSAISGTTALAGTTSTLSGGAFFAGNGGAVADSVQLLGAADGSHLPVSGQPNPGDVLTVNGHTITFEAGSPPSTSSVPAGSGVEYNFVNDGQGNSQIYLGTVSGGADFDDLSAAIDIATGAISVTNISGGAHLSGSPLSTANSGSYVIASVPGEVISIAGRADFLNAIGLTSSTGSGNVTASQSQTATAASIGTPIVPGSTLVVDGKTITFSGASSPSASASHTGVNGHLETDGSGNSTVYLGNGTTADILNAIDLATGVQTATLSASGATLATTSGDTASTVATGGALNISTGAVSNLTITSTGNALAALGLAGASGTNTSFTATTSAGGGLSGQTLTFGAVGNGTATTVTFGNGTSGTVKTLDQLNSQLAADNLQATLDTTGKLTISTTNDAASATIGAIGGSATNTSNVFNGATASTPVADAAAQTTRATLVSQYNAILTQIDNTAADASYNGVNLLNGDQLQLTFNETGKSKLNITGVNFGSAGLGLSALTNTSFQDNDATNNVLTTLNTVSSTLRSEASALGSNLSVVQTRQDFNTNLINVLQTGSANLTQADINLEAANSQALSTRQSLSVSALSLANQSQQSVLQLLR